MGASLHLDALGVMYRPPTHGRGRAWNPVKARWYFFAAMEVLARAKMKW